MKLVVLCGAALLCVLFGLFVILIGVENPLWQLDHYVLEGTFSGDSCSLRLDGRPIVGNEALGTRVIIPGNYTAHIGAPLGYSTSQEPTEPARVQGIFCRGVSVTIAPAFTHGGAGSYVIVEQSEALGPGQAGVELSSDDVDRGWWPFALGGARLVGHEGALTITTMTDSTLRGTFRVVARRHVRGFEG